jgi:DNA-binding beta-propeller fold protein YncE
VDDGAGATVVLGKLRGRTLAFIADEDDRAVHVVDVARGEDLGSVPLGSRPSQLVLTRDGKLLVALRDANAVATLEAPEEEEGAPLLTTSRFVVDAEPTALAVTPDDGTVVVATERGHAVEAVDRAMGERTFEVEVAREPRALLVSADGATAYVAHAAASVLTMVDLHAGTAKIVGADRARGSTIVPLNEARMR